MRKNKNAFTLVELISVLVILMLLFVLAVSRVRQNILNSQLKATKAAGISFVKGVEDLVAVNNSEPTKPYIGGLLTYAELKKLGVNLEGKKPTFAVAYVYEGKVVSACIQVDENKVNYLHGKFKDAIKGECKSIDGYNKVTRTNSIDYIGSEETVTLNQSGKYVIEAWGARGGSINDTYTGGYGAYAQTEFFLEPGETLTLYINVGGKGKNNCRQANCAGGYNGGSDTGSGTDSNVYYASGGGATSVALQSGLLSTLENDSDKIILVAAGGGGASYVNSSAGNNGGAGGGIIGNSSLTNQSANKLYYGTGGSQKYGGVSSFTSSTAGSFGKGGEFTEAINNVASAGAGGGYYGGGYAGGGGSSYFANSFVIPSSDREVETKNSIMYCDNCTESSMAQTRTKKTTGTNKVPLSGRLRDGNGFVRITKIED